MYEGMLVQLPRPQKGTPVREPSAALGAETADQFEAGLRRDLASTPFLSLDAALGGWRKRALDIALVIATAPLWIVLMIAAAIVADVRRLPVFVSDRRIGHGGRSFECVAMMLSRPTADIVQLHPQNGAASAPPARFGLSFQGLVERLPQVFSVLRGDMSLVGPRPLQAEDLETLSKGGRKAYLGARPGIFSLSDVEEEGTLSAQLKHYALTWSVASDLVLLGEVLLGALRLRR